MNVRELEEIPFFLEKFSLLNIHVYLCIYIFGQTDKVMFSNPKVVFSNLKVMFSNPFARIVLTEKCKTELMPTAVLLSACRTSGKKCV